MWSTKFYQVICFYHHLHSEHPQFFEAPSSLKILAIWKKIFNDGAGAHCAHTCPNKTCVRHLRIASRKQNEIDKHWMFFWSIHYLAKSFLI